MKETLAITDNEAIKEMSADSANAISGFDSAHRQLRNMPVEGHRSMRNRISSVMLSGFYSGVGYQDIVDPGYEYDETIVVFPQIEQTRECDYTKILMNYLHMTSGGARVISLFDAEPGVQSIGDRLESTYLAPDIDKPRSKNKETQTADIQLAAKFADAIGKLGVRYAQFVGIQTGAPIAANTARVLKQDMQINVGSMLLVEPVNVEDRGPHQLYTSMSPGSYRGLKKIAIQTSQIKALSQSYLGYSESIFRKSTRENMKSYERNYRKACYLYDSGRLLQSVARNSLFDQLSSLASTYKVILQGAGSSVSPDHSLQNIEKIAPTTKMVQETRLGSGVIYHIPTLALLSGYAQFKAEQRY